MISFCIFLFSFGCVFFYDLYNPPQKIQNIKNEEKEYIFPFIITCLNSIIQSICVDYFTIHKLEVSFTLYNTIISFPFYFIITDFYFYHSHRLLHLPIIYKYFHKMHHKYKSPSICASYYEHPVEHLLVWSIPYLVLPYIIPINNIVYWIFVFYTSLLSVLGHCGNNYKLNIWYIIDFQSNINSYYYYTHPYHHDLHHQKTNCNYSLYFTYLDRIYNTLDNGYDVYVKQKVKEE
jgi:lathosterol oxidase